MSEKLTIDTFRLADDYILKDRQRVKKIQNGKMEPLYELWLDEHRVYATNPIAIHIVNHTIFIRDENRPDPGAVGAITAITAITEKISRNTICLCSEKKENLYLLKIHRIKRYRFTILQVSFL